MNKLLSVQEVAKILGISRIAVFKKIKKGEIPAEKIGRAYVIDSDNLTIIKGKKITTTQKDLIDNAVEKTISDYGETLKLLKDT